MNLQAVIFDLDGVITDTSEFHYLAWKQMADEEGLAFDRHVNERLRGVSRRASLEIILSGADRAFSEEQILEMMERKNGYYVAMLHGITPANLLPGALPLIEELRDAGIKVAIGSASKNTRTVLDKLGIVGLMDVVADGFSVTRTKPAPDLFLWAVEQLAVSPGHCAVVEDAEAGIDAALAAGAWAIGLGPAERVGDAHARFDSLEGVTLVDLLAALETSSWTVAEHTFEPDRQRHMETLLTVGNGYVCARGVLEEGYPGDTPMSFVHRLWDDMPVNVTELACIPEWWGVDAWVNGHRFRLDRGHVVSYRRWLDMRTGVLSRTVRWQPHDDGPVVELRFQRFASYAEPHLAVVRAALELVEGDRVSVRLRAGLNTHVENSGLLHWNPVEQEADPGRVHVHVRTRATCTDLAMVATVDTSGTMQWTAQVCDADGQPTVERYATLRQGDVLTVVKYVGIVTGNDTEDPLCRAVAIAQAAMDRGYAATREASDARWSEAWSTSDVVIEGDIEAQMALRFSLYHLLIAAPRHTERASIGAKTLSGLGYRHHAFWDTEIFMLPFFVYTQPHLARNMLMYRWHNLPGARAKAAGNGYEGAQFPWESAGKGTEVTPTWLRHFADPSKLVRIWTGDIEIHITADIAYAAMQYWSVTGDDAWMRDYGAEIVLDGAKFWASAAQLGNDGKYHYRNVVGPDENHDRVDDNAFTNALARWQLGTGLEMLDWLQADHPERYAELVEALDLSEVRLAHWADVMDRISWTADPETGLIEQFRGFFSLEEPDFAAMRDPGRTRSMQEILDIEGCAQTQILKQPDVLMLQYLLPDLFAAEQVGTNYAYYDPRTDHEHGSSLAPSISAAIACRVGDSAAAYGHFVRAARADLLDVRRNSDAGIHGANAGGLWQATVFGFAGLRLRDDGWTTSPRLPAHWTRLAFKFYHRGELQVVDIRTEKPRPAG